MVDKRSMTRKILPSVEILNEIFDYNPMTGIILWKNSPHKCIPINSIAGSKKSHYKTGTPTHIEIVYEGEKYQAHRIAWKMYYGTEPPYTIDHYDTNGWNNVIGNLRIAAENKNCYDKNRFNTRLKKNNKTGHKGIIERINGYQAQIGAYNKRYTKRFKYIEDAVKWRREQVNIHHKEFARHE